MPASVTIEVDATADIDNVRRRIAPVAAGSGATLRMHATRDDQAGVAYLSVEAPDLAAAERLADAVRSLTGVRSAHAKPGEALP